MALVVLSKNIKQLRRQQGKGRKKNVIKEIHQAASIYSHTKNDTTE